MAGRDLVCDLVRDDPRILEAVEIDMVAVALALFGPLDLEATAAVTPATAVTLTTPASGPPAVSVRNEPPVSGCSASVVIVMTVAARPRRDQSSTSAIDRPQPGELGASPAPELRALQARLLRRSTGERPGTTGGAGHSRADVPPNQRARRKRSCVPTTAKRTAGARLHAIVVTWGYRTTRSPNEPWPESCLSPMPASVVVSKRSLSREACSQPVRR